MNIPKIYQVNRSVCGTYTRNTE